jgi:hypothetical protein
MLIIPQAFEFVKRISQILLRNYYFECLGGPCIPTFEHLPQEVSVYLLLTAIIIPENLEITRWNIEQKRNYFLNFYCAICWAARAN